MKIRNSFNKNNMKGECDCHKIRYRCNAQNPQEDDIFCYASKDHKGKHYSCGRFHKSYRWE